MSRTSAVVQRWRRIIREQQASGLSVAEYCRRTGVSAWSLYSWRLRLRPQRKAPAKFVEVQVPRRGPETSAERLDLGASSLELCLSEASGIELHLPGSRWVMVRPGFDGPTLLALLQVLEANPARVETEEAGT